MGLLAVSPESRAYGLWNHEINGRLRTGLVLLGYYGHLRLWGF